MGAAQGRHGCWVHRNLALRKWHMWCMVLSCSQKFLFCSALCTLVATSCTLLLCCAVLRCDVTRCAQLVRTILCGLTQDLAGTVLSCTPGCTQVLDQGLGHDKHLCCAAQSEASGRVVDSLINFEAVKYFSNEKHEVGRIDCTGRMNCMGCMGCVGCLSLL